MMMMTMTMMVVMMIIMMMVTKRLLPSNSAAVGSCYCFVAVVFGIKSISCECHLRYYL